MTTLNKYPSLGSTRKKDLDVLRVIALICVLTAHTAQSYLTAGLNRVVANHIANFGLCLFTLLSGLTIGSRYRRLNNLRDVWAFLRNRMLRVYPLYVLALLLYVVLFSYCRLYHTAEFSPVIVQTVSHLAGAQVLVGSYLPPMFTLWFVGFVMLCYVAYACLARLCESTTGMVVGGGVIALVALTAKAAFGLFEDRFFLFFPVFMVGVMTSRLGMTRTNLLGGGLLLGALVMALLSRWILSPLADEHLKMKWLEYVREACMVTYLAIGAVAIAFLLRSITEHIPPRLFHAVELLSIGSYAAYLFHRPVLAVLKTLLGRLGPETDYVQDIVILVIGLPLVFVLSYGIMTLEAQVGCRIASAYRGRRLAKPVSSRG